MLVNFIIKRIKYILLQIINIYFLLSFFMVFNSENLPYNLTIGLSNFNPKSLSTSVRNCLENKFDYFVTNIFDN